MSLPTKEFAPGNDITFEVSVAPSIDPATGRSLPYPGTTITGFLAEEATPATPINGTVKTFTRYAVGRFVWTFDAAELTPILASLSPAPANGQRFLAVAVGAGEFNAARPLAYRAARVL